MSIDLLNPCKYSFEDLIFAAKKETGQLTPSIKQLLLLSQTKRNEEVKALCNQAKWFYKDVIGRDGVLYTSFSPHLKIDIFD